MKEEISGYMPLVQKPDCCNAACLQTILLRRGLGFFMQEAIARQLGVKIQEKYIGAFRAKMPVTKNVEELGIMTVRSEAKINKFFSANKMSLAARAYPASHIKDVKEFIFNNLRKGNDLWVEFHLDEREKDTDIHDNLVQKIECKNKKCTITTIDPGYLFRQFVEWPLDMLERSISTKYGRECGFVVISSTHS